MSLEANTGTGVLNSYGARGTNQKYGGNISTKGNTTEVAWTFSYDDLPVGGTDQLGVSIPANAKIISAKIEFIAAFTSTSTTTDLTVGLEQADGTDIDVDGFLTAAQLTQTVIDNTNTVIVGTGALVGATVGAAAGELVVIPSVDDLLTGQARVIVEYSLDALAY